MKQNLHTHTTYCDGKNTPRETIEIAKKLGFDSVGFSGHSYMSYSPSHSMSINGTNEYFNEITELKKEFDGEIQIFCGIEYDLYSDVDISRYDYRLGAVHYLKIGNEYVGFDRSSDVVKDVIDTYFDGNGLRFAEEYYKQFSQLPNYGDFDIVAHFDLVAKHSDNIEFFKEDSKEYISYYLDVMKALKDKVPFFEVNTGGMARGYKKSPYPAKPILKELKNMGFGAVISSDCHDATKMDCGFDVAKQLLLDAGFSYQYVLTKKGFEAIPIE